MRLGRTGARLRKELGAGLAVLLGLFSLASPAAALTWGEINQRLDQCMTLADEAKSLVGGVKGVRDKKSNKKEVAKLRKAEKKLAQVVDIYQTLKQATFPPAKASPNISSGIKSSISRNRSLAQNYLEETQSLRRIVEKEALGLVGAGVKMRLLIDLNDLRYQTSRLQDACRRITSSVGRTLRKDEWRG